MAQGMGEEVCDAIAELRRAIADSRPVTEIEALLNRNAYLERAAAHNGFTLLHAAASAGHAGLAGLLLDRGADIEAVTARLPSSGESTPLHVAVSTGKAGNVAVVNVLLDRGADLGAKDDEDTSVLYSAVSSGRADVVSLLFARGADLKVGCWSHADVVGFLLTCGDDMRAGGRVVGGAIGCLPDHDLLLCADMKSVLRSVVRWANADMVGSLLDRCGNSRVLEGDTSVLHSVASSRNTDGVRVVSLLLKHGANPRAVDDKGASVLHSAVSSGNTDVVELLLGLGVDDIHARDHKGRSALAVAVGGGSAALVTLLVERGADLEGESNRPHPSGTRNFTYKEILERRGFDPERLRRWLRRKDLVFYHGTEPRAWMRPAEGAKGSDAEGGAAAPAP